MLILSRRAGQGIRIGDAIRVQVVTIDGQFVRLGIEAPASAKILREELWRQVATDNQAAIAAPAPADAYARLIGQGVPPSDPAAAAGSLLTSDRGEQIRRP